MKSLLLLVCSLLLLVTVSNGQDLNCNLQNGAGCYSTPNFNMEYKFTHPGSSYLCKRAYNLRVYVPSYAKGFECTFVTDKSQQANTYRYTISHNPYYFWDYNTPYIRVYDNHALISMAGVSSGIYNNNWWYHPDMHAPYGYSWANYRFEQRKLNYYSSETGIHHNSGHPYGFNPVSKTTYIGLNKRYGSNSYGGYGLCQVYCRILTSFDSSSDYSPRSAASPGPQGAQGSDGPQGQPGPGAAEGGENLSAPSPPSGPPAPPTDAQ